MKLLSTLTLATALIPLVGTAVHADSLTLSGPDSLDGSYTASQIQSEATSSNTETYTSNGTTYTGVALWSFLGGSDTTVSTPTAGGTTKTYGAISTFNPTGANTNPNYDLRYYVVGTGTSGTTAVSLGQIDPGFTGSSSATPFLAFQSNGGLLSTPVLVVPGGPSGSTVVNLTSLAIQSVPASSGPGGVSTGVTTSGNVTSPQTYTSFPGSNSSAVTTATPAGGPTYTGIPLATLLNIPSTVNPNSQIVVATGTDGYTVVYSYDELLNADGSANTNDLLAYASTGTDFPGSGIARTITAGDGAFKHGRWDSNVDSLEVLDVTPAPASLPLFAAGILAFGLFRIVSKRKGDATQTFGC